MTAGALLDGRHGLVTGGDSGFGRELALGLRDHGAEVGAVAGSALSSHQMAAGAFRAAAAELGAVDIVVHAALDAGALAPVPVSELDDAGWDAGCESLLRAALWCCQAAFETFGDRGGRLVLVTPTVGLVGAAGIVAFTTAVEGMRAMAKSAARQWGSRGITANCVAPALDVLVPGASPAGGAPAGPLGRAPDARRDVAPVVALLASDAAHFVTGATIAVDGGVVMLP